VTVKRNGRKKLCKTAQKIRTDIKDFKKKLQKKGQLRNLSDTMLSRKT